ncbi:hypothetical protein [Streptomyces sp. NBC_00343]|uniref:hypothetical protein n=1 Tax=Streptomyces sp. NBC_00343 TaxID=2975719 RepID=UPI002E283A55|nr:hypothetical protein [Streptomyces sp. NBC_00343]
MRGFLVVVVIIAALLTLSTLFQYVQAVTGGPVARIDQAGGYAQPSLRGETFAVRPGSIALRLDGGGIDTAVIARDEGTVAVALRLLDAAGRTVHQGRPLSEGDRPLVGLAPTVDAGTRAAVASALTRFRRGSAVANWHSWTRCWRTADSPGVRPSTAVAAASTGRSRWTWWRRSSTTSVPSDCPSGSRCSPRRSCRRAPAGSTSPIGP